MHMRVGARRSYVTGIIGWLVWAVIGCGDSAAPAGQSDAQANAPGTLAPSSVTPPMAASAGMVGAAAGMPARTLPPMAAGVAVAGSPAPASAVMPSMAGMTAQAVAGSPAAVVAAAGASAGMSAAIGGAPGSAGVTGSAGSAGAVAAHEDLGKGDGKDVICIGDSWMLLTLTGIQTGLVKASGQPYRTYGVPGTQLLNGQIPSQYDQAKRADPDIKTVVMTGGGNDLLLTGSTQGNAASSQIDMVAKRLGEMWAQMGKDGVKDIVYVEYSRGGTNEKNVNEGIMKVRPVCEAVTPARCHFVDSDETIHMQLRDGIHPTDAGYDALGKTIYALMEKEGMRR